MYRDFSEKYYSTIEEYVDFHENGTEKFSGEDTFVGSSLIRWVFHINNIINCSKFKLYLWKLDIIFLTSSKLFFSLVIVPVSR